MKVSDEFRRRMTDESAGMAETYEQRAAAMQEEFDSITTVDLTDVQVSVVGLGFQLYTWN